jgi:hypothetical protein
MRTLTEAAWRRSSDPQDMLAHLGENADARKLRLFACGCVRQVWQAADDPASRRAVAAAERFADGQLGRAQLDAVLVRAWGHGCAPLRAPVPQIDTGWETVRATFAAVLTAPAGVAMRAAAVARRAATFLVRLRTEPDPAFPDPDPYRSRAWRTVTRRQADLLREIFANPFRLPRVDPAWAAADGGRVTRLARGIHEGRDFAELPILADALEEAGCADAALLGHLRSGGPHVPGCWALDLFLGRPDDSRAGPSLGRRRVSNAPAVVPPHVSP